uniref:Piwi domain-containing protein n=1 Tax=Panagrolaimus sp. JU765 TaxID=591449 RepID=A0AC34PWX7_9BILA
MMSVKRGSSQNNGYGNSGNNNGSRRNTDNEYPRPITPQSKHGSQSSPGRGRKESYASLTGSACPSPPASYASNTSYIDKKGKPWETFPRFDPRMDYWINKDFEYPLELNNFLVYRYQVEIHCVSKTCTNNKKTNNKNTNNINITTEKTGSVGRQLCYYIIKEFIKQNFPDGKIQIVYDNLYTLLSNVEFDDINGMILKKHLPDEIKRYFPEDAAITVKIKKHQCMPKINLDDLNQYKAEESLLFENRTVLRSLEIIVFQGLIDSRKYLAINGKLYQETGTEFEPGYCTKIGVCKGIRMLGMETTDSNGNLIKKWKPTLIVNCRKFPFYEPGKFSDLVFYFLQNYHGDEKKRYHEAERAFQGLKLSPFDKPNVILQFKKFTSTFAKSKECKCDDNNEYLLESLEVLPNQYVNEFPYDDIYDNSDQAKIQTVYENVLADLKTMVFNSKILKSYGISFMAEVTQNSSPPNIVEFNKKVKKLMKNLKNFGIVLEEPSKENCPRFWFENFEQFYKRCQEANISYVLVIDKQNTSKSRGLINLMESLYKIPTQQIPLEIFEKLFCKDQNFKLARVLREFNVKNGGINYIPKFSNMPDNLNLETRNIFVIAYGKPEKIEETENLSIVGFSANFGENPWKFNVGYFYQDNQEMVNLHELEAKTENMLKMIKNEHDIMPKTIVVFRYGFPADDFGRIFTKEISAIETGCKNFDENYNPKFVTAVTSECSYNLQTGTFVNEKVVQMEYSNHYMTYDKTTNNTANFVNNFVFRNDSDNFDDRLFLYSLCYGHQVQATSTFYRTALPMPIYNVGEMTKKGAEVYETLKAVQCDLIPKFDGKIDYKQLSNLLG